MSYDQIVFGSALIAIAIGFLLTMRLLYNQQLRLEELERRRLYREILGTEMEEPRRTKVN